ncbi:MAG TPA: TIGR01777 family oxidoreductase [Roseiflexaceae bacterium]|nr:TIGR01777 family oxidoreductase [Roseiflexaceae bacterium]
MSNEKRVVVTGATGHIGRPLCRRLRERGYSVVVFSRNPAAARRSVPGAAEYVAWRPEEQGAWAAAVDGAHAVIHLAAASLFERRWSAAYKREIVESRRLGTRGLVRAMAQARARPKVFVSMSAVGYYGPHGDEPLDEHAPPGDDFLARVCRDAWESEAARAEELGVRTVIVRSGVVIGGEGPMRLPIDLRGASLSRPGLILKTEEGALPLLVLPFHFFLGGPILPGTQYISWIHIDDIVGILLMALEDERVRGPINATAPEPRTNREFVRTIGRVMGRPAWLPIPGFALRLLLGEMGDMVTTGQRVIPRKAQELGYRFAHPELEEALRSILK